MRNCFKMKYELTDLEFIGLVLFSGFGCLINMFSTPHFMVYGIIIIVGFFIISKKTKRRKK